MFWTASYISSTHGGRPLVILSRGSSQTSPVRLRYVFQFLTLKVMQFCRSLCSTVSKIRACFENLLIHCLATRHKANPRMQIALFLLSLGVGPRMIWLINWGSWLVNMRQVCCFHLGRWCLQFISFVCKCPQFATIWLYTIVQLNLNWAVLSLVMIGAWAWFTGMKLTL